MLLFCPREIVKCIVSLSGFGEQRNLRSTCRALRSLVGEDITWNAKNIFFLRGRRVRFFWGPHRESLLLRIVCERWDDVLRVFLDRAPKWPNEWDAADRSYIACKRRAGIRKETAKCLGRLSEIVNRDIYRRPPTAVSDLLAASLRTRRMLAEATGDDSIADFCREAEMLDRWTIVASSRESARWSLPGNEWEIVYRGGRNGVPPPRLILRRRITTRQKRKREIDDELKDFADEKEGRSEK